MEYRKKDQKNKMENHKTEKKRNSEVMGENGALLFVMSCTAFGVLLVSYY